MMPLNPNPKIAATANSPASFWVSKNPVIAVIWHTEPASIVRKPPMRSVTSPQNWRLTKATPSNTDSIAAPCAGAIPTSVQNATRWPCGIAIGTQHIKPGETQHPHHQARPQSERCTAVHRPGCGTDAGDFRRRPEHGQSGRHNHDDDKNRIAQH